MIIAHWTPRRQCVLRIVAPFLLTASGTPKRLAFPVPRSLDRSLRHPE
jgi:hypothetical protein